MEQYFGHKPQDWERSMMTGLIDGSGQGKEMQKAVANPDQYTTARPNMSTKAAFTVGSKKGAGKDGMTNGPATAYYKIEKPTSTAPTQQAPAPKPEAPASEPAKDKGPVEYSTQMSEAKERVANYKMDGNAGSTFSTSAPTETPEPDAMPNSVSFEPAEINTPAYNPNAGNAEQAQGFADKYKLNLLNKGAGQSDFSAV